MTLLTVLCHGSIGDVQICSDQNVLISGLGVLAVLINEWSRDLARGWQLAQVELLMNETFAGRLNFAAELKIAAAAHTRTGQVSAVWWSRDKLPGKGYFGQGTRRHASNRSSLRSSRF